MTKRVNKRKIMYWAATAITATAYFSIGVANLVHSPAIVAGLSRIGYPAYLTTILGMWNLLGAAAIIAPGLPRLKEWAYAGMFFNLTGAALSHAASGDSVGEIVAPVGLLVVVLISMALRSARSGAIGTQARVPQVTA